MSLTDKIKNKLAEKTRELERTRKQQKNEGWRDLKAEIHRLEGATRALRWALDQAMDDAQAGLFAGGGVK